MKYLRRKRKERLFEQWVERANLPPEEVPSELLGEQSAEEVDFDISQRGIPGYTALIDVNGRMVRLPVRYVFLGLSIMALLLVALSIVVTILIVRP